jgi:hypothetical protein
MLENYAHILQHLLITTGPSSSSSDLGGVIAQFVVRIKDG